MRVLLVLFLHIVCASPAFGADAIWQPDEQWIRSKAMIDQFAKQQLASFDDKGNWVGLPNDKPRRSIEMSGHVAPFLTSGNKKAIAVAIAVLENQMVHQLDAAYALVRHREKLSDAAVARCESIVKKKVSGEFQQFRWKSFQGDNDNFQLMAAATVSMWGTHTGNAKWTDDARARLVEFRELLTRRGSPSEFNSPAYLGLHLHPLALIAETTKDEKLKQLAIDLETRMWIELLTHYHQPSGTQGGPWAREYNWDIYGGCFTRANLYVLLGDKLPGEWSEGIQTEQLGWGIVRSVNRASVRYHCPKWLVEWTLARKYPYQVISTAEGSPSFMQLKPDRSGSVFHWNWKDGANKDAEMYTLPAWNTRLVQYQTADYSLGTSQRPFNNGKQCYAFVVTMPAKKPLASARDIVRVHARYVVDEQLPAITQQYKGGKPLGIPAAFADAGRTITLQHQQTAMVLYRPHAIVDYKPTSMKVAVYIPKKDFGSGEPRNNDIYIGKTKVEKFSGESATHEPVYVNIGDVYMALLPLVNDGDSGLKLTRKVAVRVRAEGKALAISFYNYEGEGIEMNPRQSAMIGNGFICEMGSKSEHGTFDSFRKKFAEGEYTIKDTCPRTVHSRGAYDRKVVYQRDGLKLETEYNPTTEGLRYQAINGKIPRTPQLEATDLPLDRVPFVND